MQITLKTVEKQSILKTVIIFSEAFYEQDNNYLLYE